MMVDPKDELNAIPDFIENIFQVTPPDNDCESIAMAMEPVCNNIAELLDAGCHEQAARLFIQLTLATAKHFMSDEHWACFDDNYTPDYLLGGLVEQFRRKIMENDFSKNAMDILWLGKQELAGMESVREYGYPCIDLYDMFW